MKHEGREKFGFPASGSGLPLRHAPSGRSLKVSNVMASCKLLVMPGLAHCIIRCQRNQSIRLQEAACGQGIGDRSFCKNTFPLTQTQLNETFTLENGKKCFRSRWKLGKGNIFMFFLSPPPLPFPAPLFFSSPQCLIFPFLHPRLHVSTAGPQLMEDWRVCIVKDTGIEHKFADE